MPSVIRLPGGNPEVVKGLETASETYKAGDPVGFTSGYVVVGTGGAIKGIARGDASGVADTPCEVELIDANALYVVNYKAAATSQALVGDVVDFNFSGTAGNFLVDESAASTDCYVVALDSRDPVTTSGGRLIVRFLYSNFT